MKLGILGGTFDPIHLGHLRTAEETGQELNLEKVYLIPSASPPHKAGERITFYPSQLLEPGTLSLIAQSVVIISVFLVLLLRNGGHERARRNYIVLGLTGTLIVVLSPFVRSHLYLFLDGQVLLLREAVRDNGADRLLLGAGSCRSPDPAALRHG